MRVGMCGMAAALFHPANLRTEFSFELMRRSLPAPETANHLWGRKKIAAGVHECGDFSGRQDWLSPAYVEMNSHTHVARRGGKGRGKIGSGHCDHQRSAGEEAIAVGEEHGVGDAPAHAKIVGI